MRLALCLALAIAACAGPEPFASAPARLPPPAAEPLRPEPGDLWRDVRARRH